MELLPAVNGGKVELLNNKRMLSQLKMLERRTSRAGRDTVDHAPNAHDDLINAAAGALVLALPGSTKKGRWRPMLSAEELQDRAEPFIPIARYQW